MSTTGNCLQFISVRFCLGDVNKPLQIQSYLAFPLYLNNSDCLEDIVYHSCARIRKQLLSGDSATVDLRRFFYIFALF